jgi:hypothetical protein
MDDRARKNLYGSVSTPFHLEIVTISVFLDPLHTPSDMPIKNPVSRDLYQMQIYAPVAPIPSLR